MTPTECPKSRLYVEAADSSKRLLHVAAQEQTKVC